MADDPGIGKGSHVAQIQDQNILRLFGFGGMDGGEPKRVEFLRYCLIEKLFGPCQDKGYACWYCTISLMPSSRGLLSAEQVQTRTEAVGAESDRGLPGGEPAGVGAEWSVMVSSSRVQL